MHVSALCRLNEPYRGWFLVGALEDSETEPGSSQGMQREACGGTRHAQRLLQPGEGSADQD